MKDIFPFLINLPTTYVSSHKHEIQDFFYKFDEKINTEYSNIQSKLELKLKFKFNRYGGLIIPLSEINKDELNRLQIIENSFFGCPFFKKSNNIMTNRGAVYYTSGIIEQDYIKIIRLISMLEISLDLTDSFINDGAEIDSYSLLSLIDDIRYKSLLIYEYLLSQEQDTISIKFEKLVQVFSCSFYKLVNKDFDQQKKKIAEILMNSIKVYRNVLNEFTNSCVMINTDLQFKTYKEADSPEMVWMFLTKLKETGIKDVQSIIGIRFGGIELPYVIKDLLLPNAEVSTVKISTYSDQVTNIVINSQLIKSKNILLVDDNILTGRTLGMLINEMRVYEPKNIFFACLSYSGMKRYPQMIMENHGIINPEVLENSCIISRSEFTRISSSKSYKNKNGVFDKVKKEIQENLNIYNSFTFKI